MAEHNQIGLLGEQKATQYLIKEGYKILDVNWRFKHYEIDIIAETESHISIVEVKTRTVGHFTDINEVVGFKKRKFLIQAANAYAEKFEISKDIYFDIICIVLEPKEKLEHIKEAFYPQ